MLSLLLSACSGVRPNNLGVQPDQTLAACPDSPNCVSSFAPKDDETHYIAPYEIRDGGWQALKLLVSETPRVTVIQADDQYLYVEAKTRLLRFVDDVEFLYQPEQQLIQLRSASRIGYSDFGKNRSRLEEWRRQLEQQGFTPSSSQTE
ncbi:DUF1499 domain-containing protein [Marinobacteraceae bacterium S3BR75-40.1]